MQFRIGNYEFYSIYGWIKFRDCEFLEVEKSCGAQKIRQENAEILTKKGTDTIVCMFYN